MGNACPREQHCRRQSYNSEAGCPQHFTLAVDSGRELGFGALKIAELQNIKSIHTLMRRNYQSQSGETLANLSLEGPCIRRLSVVLMSSKISGVFLICTQNESYNRFVPFLVPSAPKLKAKSEFDISNYIALDGLCADGLTTDSSFPSILPRFYEPAFFFFFFPSQILISLFWPAMNYQITLSKDISIHFLSPESENEKETTAIPALGGPLLEDSEFKGRLDRRPRLKQAKVRRR